MNAKQTAMVEALLAQIEPSRRALAAELAAHLDSLGYRPRRKKAVGYVLEFYHAGLRKGIMKLRAVGGALIVNLRFSAAEAYSEPFAQAIRRAVEHTTGYTQIDCAHCGVCGPLPRTYRYAYPGGPEVAHCGSVALSLGEAALERGEEIKRLLSRQHGHFKACAQLPDE